jgi:peptide/nickel transport system permease protein
MSMASNIGEEIGTEPVGDAEVDLAAPPVSRFRLIARRFARNRLALISLVVLVLMFVMAFGAIHLTKWSYSSIDYTAFLQPPNGSHWFGTTSVGQDMFAQTMRGMQKSLIIGLLVAILSTGTAAAVGTYAAYYGGWVDTVLMWCVDLLLVMPSFLLIAILSPHFHGHTWLIFVLLLAAFNWMITARIVRSMTLTLKNREFVMAARFMGVPGRRIILRHILPNISSLLIIDATINVGVAIIGEASLSYFGFGIQPPDVSLGTVIANQTQNAVTYPYLFFIPAGMLVIIVLCVNFIGDGLRDALDPNSSKATAR